MISVPDKVVVTHWIHPEVVDHLETFCDPDTVPARTVRTRAETLTRAADARGLLACMADHVDDDFLAACPDLRIISGTLKGYDNFDVDACTRHGVWLTALPDQLTAPAAELCVGLTIALMRNVVTGDKLVRTGTFEGWRPQLYGASLAGATVGIIGMGLLGQAVAHRLQAFDATVIHHDRNKHDSVPLPELFAKGDVVMPLVPLTQTTAKLIDRAALATMRPGSYLVNVSRGSLVDEMAVLDALDANHLAGYAADVFAMEDWARADRPDRIPPALLRHPRTVFTPHLGSAVNDVRRAMSLAAADQIAQVFAGRRPEYAVNELPC